MKRAQNCRDNYWQELFKRLYSYKATYFVVVIRKRNVSKVADVLLTAYKETVLNKIYKSMNSRIFCIYPENTRQKLVEAEN